MQQTAPHVQAAVIWFLAEESRIKYARFFGSSLAEIVMSCMSFLRQSTAPLVAFVELQLKELALPVLVRKTHGFPLHA
jgi:hypothetical protein